MATAPAGAAGPDVDALISYETHQLSANGVTRIERWQERLVRRGETVWTERVLPAAAVTLHAHESAAEHAAHKHFDFDSAARWLQRDPGGALRLRYVDRDQRVVVTVPKAEFGAVGFDGRWEAAAHVVPPALIERMQVAGPDLREERAQGWSHRVRWSQRWQLPLRLESQRDDGSVRRIVTVTATARAPDALTPWSAIDGGYAQKEYDDFSD